MAIKLNDNAKSNPLFSSQLAISSDDVPVLETGAGGNMRP